MRFTYACGIKNTGDGSLSGAENTSTRQGTLRHIFNVVPQRLFLKNMFSDEVRVGGLGEVGRNAYGTTDGWFGNGDPALVGQTSDGPVAAVRLWVHVSGGLAGGAECKTRACVKGALGQEMRLSSYQRMICKCYIDGFKFGFPEVAWPVNHAVSSEESLGLELPLPLLNILHCYGV